MTFTWATLGLLDFIESKKIVFFELAWRSTQWALGHSSTLIIFSLFTLVLKLSFSITLSSFAEKRLAEVTSSLEETLRILKSRQAKDPDFELAITAFAKVEAARAKSDSAEGKVADVKRGPVQARIRKLLNA